jgi:hypothetical protein
VNSAAFAIRNGLCDLHLHPEKAREIGRLGGLARAARDRRRRERAFRQSIDLLAEKKAGLAELHVTAARIRAGWERLAAQRVEAREELDAEAIALRRRIAREFEAERRELEEEAARLKDLQRAVAVIDAEEWVRARRRLLGGREASVA